jgi:hypothetical protein
LTAVERGVPRDPCSFVPGASLAVAVLLLSTACWDSHRLESDGTPEVGVHDDVDVPFETEAEVDGFHEADAEVDWSADAEAEADTEVEADGDACTPGTPSPLVPENGNRTGSPWGAAVSHALRPVFRWRPASPEPCAPVRFELQLDDSCTTPGFAACPFPSPEGEASGLTDPSWRPAADLPIAWSSPVGRRYYWRVRACVGSTCSTWSAVRYVDVGRVSADFDGDGYSDVVVGAHWQDAGAIDEGSVFLFRGGPGGVEPSPAVTLDNPRNQPAGYFGVSVAAAGDIDADGFDDLLVGADWQTTWADREGSAYLYRGGPDGVGTVPDATLDNPDRWTLGIFGVSVASAGDANGDGFADVVIGAPGQSGEGRAFVYFGGAGGLATAPSATASELEAERDAAFGVSVAFAGDVDGDGVADALVGAFRRDGAAIDEGRAYLFEGTGGGFDPHRVLELRDPEGQPEAFFGASVAGVGDVDGDGYADWAVGAYKQDATAPDEGLAFLYRGGSGELSDVPAARLAGPSPSPESYFGYAVAAAGDLDADGFDDFAVGAPRVDAGAPDEGNAYVYHGAPGTPATAPWLTLDSPENADGGWFGWSLAGAGDVNGDGYDDLLIGAPWQSGIAVSEGYAFLYLGGPGGIAATPAATLTDPVHQEWALFGASVR